MKLDTVNLAQRQQMKLLKLTNQQKAFCEAYMTHFDGFLAYDEAGYSPMDMSKGHMIANQKQLKVERILETPVVQEYMLILKESVAARLKVSVDKIVDEYRAMAFANMSDYISWSDQGVVFLKSSDDLSYAQKAGVCEITETVTKQGVQMKIKLHSKQPALDRLFEILKELETTEGGDDKQKIKARAQINIILKDPAMRRSIEVLTDGLHGTKILLSSTDRERAAFDDTLQRVTQKYLEAEHGPGEQTLIGKRAAQKVLGGGGGGDAIDIGGNAPEKDGFGKPEDSTSDKEGGAHRERQDGEGGEPSGFDVEINVSPEGEDEKSRYDIDGL